MNLKKKKNFNNSKNYCTPGAVMTTRGKNYQHDQHSAQIIIQKR